MVCNEVNFIGAYTIQELIEPFLSLFVIHAVYVSVIAVPKTDPFVTSNPSLQAEYDQIQASFLVALEEIENDLARLAQPDAIGALETEKAHRQIAVTSYKTAFDQEKLNRLNCAINLLTKLNDSASDIGFTPRENTVDPHEAEQNILSILSEIDAKSLNSEFKRKLEYDPNYLTWKKATREIDQFPRRNQENEQQLIKIARLLEPDAKKNLEARRKEIQSQLSKITKEMRKKAETTPTAPSSGTESSSKGPIATSENGFVYDLITGANTEFEMAGMTLLAIGKPTEAINALFDDLHKALDGETSIDIKASYLSNAQNLLLKLISFDSENVFFPDFSHLDATSDSIQNCRDIISRQFGENKVNEFFNPLAVQQTDNIAARRQLTTLLEATTQPANPKFDIGQIVSQEVIDKGKTKAEIKSMARMMAQELKKIQVALSASIPMTDLIENRWTKPGSTASSNTVFFNRLSNSVQAQILNAKSLPNQARVAKFYVQVMKQCREEGDYNSYLSILAALRSTPIRRLSYIAQIPMIERELEFAGTITSQEANAKEFRKEIKSNKAPIVIPYTGLMYTDLTFTQDGNPNIINSKLNTAKMELLYKILTPFRQLSSKAKENPLPPPESNAYIHVMNTPVPSDDQNFKRSEQIYRKINFTSAPTLSELFKAVTTPASRFKLGAPFEFRFPKIPDISLEYEQKRLNHGYKPRLSYLFILEVITQSLNNNPSLEERFFANEMLKKIQSNIKDMPRLNSTLKSAIASAQALVNLNPALVSDLNHLATLSQKYSTMLENSDTALTSPKADFLAQAREFLDSLSEKYPELKENDSAELSQLIIAVRTNLEQLEQLETQATQYQEKIAEQEAIHSTPDENRIGRLLIVRDELENLATSMREATRLADPTVSSLAKSKIKALGIPTVPLAGTSTRWVRATAAAKPSVVVESTVTPEAKPPSSWVRATASTKPTVGTETASAQAPTVPVQSSFIPAKPSTVRPPVLRTSEQHRAKPLDHLFTAHNPKRAPTNEQSLVETQSSVQELRAYLTPENRAKHDIKTVVETVDNRKNITELEIEFEPVDTARPLKAFAKNGTIPNSMQLSTTKGLADPEFTLVAERVSALAIATAKPRSEFDLSVASSDTRREILKAAFEKAIESAMKETPPRFTQDTKPTLKMHTQPSQTAARRGPHT